MATFYFSEAVTPNRVMAQLEGFVEGWRECQCLFKRQKLEGLHVVSDLQLYLKNLSMMCTPFIRNGYTFY